MPVWSQPGLQTPATGHLWIQVQNCFCVFHWLGIRGKEVRLFVTKANYRKLTFWCT
jgi:hypothetical protein